MRTIKFRGKRTYNGEWVYGDLCNYRGNVYIKEDEDCWDIQLADEVAPETVGQFTGLMDKNGVEIYEGDVIEGPTEPQRVVEWIDEWAGFDLVQKVVSREHKIIGNIHDNPELIDQ